MNRLQLNQTYSDVAKLPGKPDHCYAENLMTGETVVFHTGSVVNEPKRFILKIAPPSYKKSYHYN